MTGPSRSAGSIVRKIVAALVLVPLAIVIIAFALANRERVTISFDPFGSGADAAFTSRPLPLFLVLIAALIIGVIVGGTASWLRHGGWRRTANRLDREVARLRAELDAHRHAAGTPPAPSPEPAKSPERLQLRAPVR